MATPSWQVSGQYYENCSCDFVCPCVPGQLAVKPTKGDCTVAMAFQVERGNPRHRLPRRSGLHRAAVDAGGDGQGQLVGRRDRRTPGPAPSSATPSPRSRADPPVVPWPPWHPWSESFSAWSRRRFASIARAPRWSVTAPGLVDIAAKPAMGINPNATEPLYLDNTGHPAADRFALAHAVNSQVTALGLSWSDMSGKNHGQYAPFSWRSA